MRVFKGIIAATIVACFVTFAFIVNKYDNYISVIIDNNQWLCYP